MTRTLKDHQYAQAHIITHDNGSVDLISYNTRVITVDRDGWMDITGLYSRTTIKHIGWFMREMYNLTYQFAKEAYQYNRIMNVYTGEIRM